MHVYSDVLLSDGQQSAMKELLIGGLLSLAGSREHSLCPNVLIAGRVVQLCHLCLLSDGSSSGAKRG